MSSRWLLTNEQRAELANILARSKPKLSDGAVYSFLDETDHVVDAWLRCWPPGWKSDAADDAAATDEFSRHAIGMLGAWRKMSDRNRYLFALRLGGFMDAGNFDYRDVYAMVREIGNRLVNFNIAESQRIDPNEGPARKLAERDLCQQLARVYARHFGRATSANTLGAFGQFINHLAENCLPAGYQTTIGSNLLRFAADESALFLNG